MRDLFDRWIDAIDAGIGNGNTPQDNSQATHTAKIYKRKGSIDWKQGAKEIECRSRTGSVSSAYTRLDDKMLKIWKAQVVSEESGAEPGCIVKVEKIIFWCRPKRECLPSVNFSLRARSVCRWRHF